MKRLVFSALFVAFGLAALVVSQFIPISVTLQALFTATLVAGLPGIILHLIGVPVLATALNRTPVGILAREEA